MRSSPVKIFPFRVNIFSSLLNCRVDLSLRLICLCSLLEPSVSDPRIHLFTSMWIQQCCESGMFIPDPDFYPSRIPDPKTATKERGEKKFGVIPFYVATNLKKSNIILVLKC
jgi:hypothetical protein